MVEICEKLPIGNQIQDSGIWNSQMVILKGSDSGVWHSELLSFWVLSIVQYSEN
jgi:hypothetical protein